MSHAPSHPRSLPPTQGGALAALGDPIRWRIVTLLAEGERCVCDLESQLEVAQSRLSYHLMVLREAGLIRGRKEGRWMYYGLDPERCETAAASLVALAERWRVGGAHREAQRCS